MSLPPPLGRRRRRRGRSRRHRRGSPPAAAAAAPFGHAAAAACRAVAGTVRPERSRAGLFRWVRGRGRCWGAANRSKERSDSRPDGPRQPRATRRRLQEFQTVPEAFQTAPEAPNTAQEGSKNLPDECPKTQKLCFFRRFLKDLQVLIFSCLHHSKTALEAPKTFPRRRKRPQRTPQDGVRDLLGSTR